MLYMFWVENIPSVLLVSVTTYPIADLLIDKYAFQVIQTQGNNPQNCPITYLCGS